MQTVYLFFFFFFLKKTLDWLNKYLPDLRNPGKKCLVQCEHSITFPLIHSEWSTLEKEMGDGLQKTGHYMDRYMK